MQNSSFQVVRQPGRDKEHLDKYGATQPNEVSSGCQVCMDDDSSRNMPNLMITLNHLFCFRSSQHLARGKFTSVPSPRARMWAPSTASSMLTWA